ncbi:MAG: hypothetical protein ABJM06_00310 [Gilvibacter sp.]
MSIFNRIVKMRSFWKSVLSLGSAFVVVMIFIYWGMSGFSKAFFTGKDPLTFALITFLSGFFYGFLVSYGKFWAKHKRDQ